MTARAPQSAGAGRWRAVGDTGWLLEVGEAGADAPTVPGSDPGTAMRAAGREIGIAARQVALARRVADLAAAVRAVVTGSGVLDVVPAARTVLVVSEAADHARVGARLREADLDGRGSGATPGVARDAVEEDVVLPVRLDGPDLDEAAALAAVTPETLAALVTGTTWTAAFGGFAPGFAYLVGGGLDVPRLPAPRVRVPAGSLALAGPYAAVYPAAGPGGWRLIGTVTGGPALFDARRAPPALLPAGRRVRFRLG